MHIIQKIALVLVIIGAINWGLIGIFNFDLVAFLFDGISEVISRIIYIVVGVSGLVSLTYLFMPHHEIEHQYQ